MFTEQTLLEQVFYVSPPVVWELGLYIDGTDPLTDLVNAEVTNSRTLIADLFAWDTDGLKNSADISCGPLVSCSVGGWFISAQGTTDVTWSQAFLSPILVSNDDVVIFSPGTISLNIA